jgi:hypothetical protein
MFNSEENHIAVLYDHLERSPTTHVINAQPQPINTLYQLLLVHFFDDISRSVQSKSFQAIEIHV